MRHGPTMPRSQRKISRSSTGPTTHTAAGNPALRTLATSSSACATGGALKAAAARSVRATGPGRLLDVGSGRGDLGVVLREQGWDVTGLEPSEAACQEARERGVQTVLGTLTTRPASCPASTTLSSFSIARARGRTSDDLAGARGRSGRRPAPRLVAELRLLAASPVRRTLVSPGLSSSPDALHAAGARLCSARGVHAARGGDVDQDRRAAGEPPVPCLRPATVRPWAWEIRRDRRSASPSLRSAPSRTSPQAEATS